MKDKVWEENEYTTPPRKSETTTEKSQENTTNITGKKFAYGEWNGIGKVRGIYKIVNKVDGKYYVGSSKNITQGRTSRWKRHVRRLQPNKHGNVKLQRAWNKYGKGSFEFVILEIVPDGKELFATEQRYLDIARSEMDKCYNLNFEASGGELHPESKQKMKDSLKISMNRPDVKKKLSDIAKQRFLDPLERKRMSIIRLGARKLYGKDSPNFNHTVFEFKNDFSGESFVGTSFDFRTKFGFKKSRISALTIGQNHRTRCGWKLVDKCVKII